jgi:two-component system, OmpR family, alkaline phosphatase synthesis response regulator PhoP
MKRILVVDDEPSIVEICRDYLVKGGFEVIAARDGAEALALARSKQPDLIILDLGLPKMDGMHVTSALRRYSKVPIIMLTARVDEADKLAGLELGADDYLTKPFSPRELVARVRAVFRRVDIGPGQSDVVRAADVTLDVPRMRTEVGKRTVDLTASEFELLETMMRQPGRVFTRAQLLDVLRGEEEEPFERAVDAHVKNLRRKIETDPRRPKYIHTVYGVGYKFSDA